MILLGKVITKLLQVFNNIRKWHMGLKNTSDDIFSAERFFENGSNIPPLTTSKQ
jgi:hypothetical protein